MPTTTVSLTIEYEVEVQVECNKDEEGWAYNVIEPEVELRDFNMEPTNREGIVRLMLDNGQCKLAIENLGDDVDEDE